MGQIQVVLKSEKGSGVERFAGRGGVDSAAREPRVPVCFRGCSNQCSPRRELHEHVLRPERLQKARRGFRGALAGERTGLVQVRQEYVHVPQEIADLYRLYLVLLNTRKPVVTGAFAVDTWLVMKDLLVAVLGSEQALAERPVAVFDVCPSPPLLWSEITCENLMDCARYRVPAELVSMPLTGATGPATLLGAVVQHTAENLSGVTIHQLTSPGAPIVWGGSPAAFDMRTGTTPMGAVETMMIDCAYAELSKHLGLPTHAYLGMSDAKVVDAQCGFESGIGTVLGALTGINMISGPGMLDFESCFSLEKLAIDAEIAGMAKRLVTGITERETPIALEIIRQVGHAGNFLRTPHTRRWFREELFMPGAVVDRDFRGEWEAKGSRDVSDRAHHRVEEIIAAYERHPLPDEVTRELGAITGRAARAAGMDRLPGHGVD